MKDQDLNKSSVSTDRKRVSRKPYEPPKATFVPLEIEERLVACGKQGICAPPLVS